MRRELSPQPAHVNASARPSDKRFRPFHTTSPGPANIARLSPTLRRREASISPPAVDAPAPSLPRPAPATSSVFAIFSGNTGFQRQNQLPNAQSERFPLQKGRFPTHPQGVSLHSPRLPWRNPSLLMQNRGSQSHTRPFNLQIGRLVLTLQPLRLQMEPPASQPDSAC